MSARSLLIYKPDGAIQVFDVAQPLVKIGRGTDNDIILEDTLRKISRHHAEIRFDAHSPPVLSDLKSSNGTYLNEEAVNGASELHADDVVRIGAYRMIFRDTAGEHAENESRVSSPFRIEV